MKMLINADIGEMTGNDTHIITHLDIGNIACGGHVGDDKSMRKMVELAMKYKVKIGAHPSYPDKVNFGRKSMNYKKDLLRQSIQD